MIGKHVWGHPYSVGLTGLTIRGGERLRPSVSAALASQSFESGPAVAD